MAIVQMMAKTCNLSAPVISILLFQLMSRDTSHSVRTSHASGSCSIQTEILNFPINHILQVSCD